MAGKNSQIHLMIETDLKNRLEKESKDNGVSLSELCRQKIGNNSQLTRIELLLERIAKKMEDDT